jgi:hypothetical protein
MAASQWQNIITAVKDQLSTIRKANGYETDAGSANIVSRQMAKS